MSRNLTIGLISGTSLDGVDVAVCEIRGHAREADVRLLASRTIPYPDAVRNELLAMYDVPQNAIARVCSMNMVIGHAFADAARQVLEEYEIPLTDIALIGSHGQTIWHQPEPDPHHPLIMASTLQIGEGSVIAAALGAPVMSDFRVADMAVGGQGAPLATYLDWAIFADPGLNRAVQNIGGIGNVTWLPAGGDVQAVRAFDTGPGNMLIDALVARLTDGRQTFDEGGQIGLAGTVDYDLLARLMADPYLDIAPPKTTGREYYGKEMVDDILRDRQVSADVIATVTAFTAHTIADAYRRWLPDLPDEVYINGGGARNPLLMRMLADALDGIPVRPTDDLGIDADAKEAVCFALIAHDSLAGYPTNIPGATGARRAVPLGKLSRLEG